MIGKLTGVLESASPDGTVVVDVGGVGYVVRLPVSAALSLSVTSGERMSLLIHTAVREDAIDLYGFPTDADLGFFKQLMSVSGIGPKTALSIMGAADTASLRRAVARGDASTLTKVFGIGKKNAERMVVELRDKIGAVLEASTTVENSRDDGDVLEALLALGYSAHEARSALKDISPEGTTRERVAAALKKI